MISAFVATAVLSATSSDDTAIRKSGDIVLPTNG